MSSFNTPSHVNFAASALSTYKFVDLVILVVDARATYLTSKVDLNSLFPKSIFLTLHSKSDLSSVKWENSFDFRDSGVRKKVVSLIEMSLAEKLKSFQDSGYLKPHFEVLIVGFPNVGKSSLINILCRKKVSKRGDYPGLTKKISKFYLGNNIWLYDSPGVLSKSGAMSGNDFYVLQLINAFPSSKRSSELGEFAFSELKTKFPKLLERFANVSETYEEFLSLFSNRLGCQTSGKGEMTAAETRFIQMIRTGELGLVSWD